MKERCIPSKTQEAICIWTYPTERMRITTTSSSGAATAPSRRTSSWKSPPQATGTYDSHNELSGHSDEEEKQSATDKLLDFINVIIHNQADSLTATTLANKTALNITVRKEGIQKISFCNNRLCFLSASPPLSPLSCYGCNRCISLSWRWYSVINNCCIRLVRFNGAQE